MFPLKNKKLIRGAQAHVNAGLGVGADYVANYIELYAPFDGVIETYYGKQGGNWSRLIRDNGDKIEFAHLSKYIVNKGRVKEGELIAITGNTGEITTNPHLHVQIFRNGKRLDPEAYDWASLKTTFMKVTIVANNITWDYKSLLPTISQWFKQYSDNKLEVVFDSVDVNLGKPPLQPYQNDKCVDINWYRENVTPRGTGEVTVLLLKPEDYQTADGHWGYMTFGDNGKPARIEVAGHNNPSYPEANEFVHQVFHEICHALYFFTGQTDRTHELLTNPNVPESQLPANRRALLNEIDYVKLQNKLITIKPMPQNQAKVVKSKNSPKVYVVYEMPSMEYLTTKANIEGFVVPATIPNTDTL